MGLDRKLRYQDGEGFLFRLPALERQGRPHIEKDVGMNYFVIYMAKNNSKWTSWKN